MLLSFPNVVNPPRSVCILRVTPSLIGESAPKGPELENCSVTAKSLGDQGMHASSQFALGASIICSSSNSL